MQSGTATTCTSHPRMRLSKERVAGRGPTHRLRWPHSSRPRQKPTLQRCAAQRARRPAAARAAASAPQWRQPHARGADFPRRQKEAADDLLVPKVALATQTGWVSGCRPRSEHSRQCDAFAFV
eukprot:6202245-Pleurochrysis_carterae.AAC.3